MRVYLCWQLEAGLGKALKMTMATNRMGETASPTTTTPDTQGTAAKAKVKRSQRQLSEQIAAKPKSARRTL